MVFKFTVSLSGTSIPVADGTWKPCIACRVGHDLFLSKREAAERGEGRAVAAFLPMVAVNSSLVYQMWQKIWKRMTNLNHKGGWNKGRLKRRNACWELRECFSNKNGAFENYGTIVLDGFRARLNVRLAKLVWLNYSNDSK